MDLLPFFTEYLGPRILGGIQFESTRYAMGTLVTFFVLWVMLHRFLTHWFEHGEDWRDAMQTELEEVVAQAKAAKAAEMI